MPENPDLIAPFRPDDVQLFRNTGAIRREHRRAVRLGDPNHDARSFEACSACDAAAERSMVIAARRARARGMDRDEALAWLSGHAADTDSADQAIVDPDAYAGRTRENLARDALRDLHPHRDALRNARRSRAYHHALEAAHDAGALSVRPASAIELLGRVAQSVQDPLSKRDPGGFVAWWHIESTLATSGYADCARAGVERVWAQVVAACNAYRPARRLLRKHVFAWIRRADQVIGSIHALPSGSAADPLARAGAARSAFQGDEPSRLDLVVEIAADRLWAREHVDRAAIERAILRALHDVFGAFETSGASAELAQLLIGRVRARIELLRRLHRGDHGEASQP